MATLNEMHRGKKGDHDFSAGGSVSQALTYFLHAGIFSTSGPLSPLSVVLLSVLGNGLVLVICYRRRKKMVGSELLCVNLAVVDFLCCICFYPLSIMSSFHHAWLGENVTCVYYGLGCFIFGLCGMFTITAISVIRYLKTCYSLVYGEGRLLTGDSSRS